MTQIPNKPAAKPLADLLRSIPVDYRAEWTEETGLRASHYAPVGRHCHEAADALDAKDAEIAKAAFLMGRLCEAYKLICDDAAKPYYQSNGSVYAHCRDFIARQALGEPK